MEKKPEHRIRHTVIFKLKHAIGSAEEKEFFDAAKKLASLPGVEQFECLKQISESNHYTYGISMEFANAGLYQSYSDHPEHTAFVQNRWLNEVVDFLEIDYALNSDL